MKYAAGFEMNVFLLELGYSCSAQLITKEFSKSFQNVIFAPLPIDGIFYLFLDLNFDIE